MAKDPLDIPHKSRVAEDGCAKAYVNDMLNLWEVLDTAKASLPLFGAVDMKHYPPVALANLDVFGLTVNVLDVRRQTADVKSQVSTMVSQMKKMEESQRLLAVQSVMGLPINRRGHRGRLFQVSLPARLPSTPLLRQPSTYQSCRQFLVPSAPTSLLFRHHPALPTPTL